MSREREFHEWIEQQNREEKDAVWAKIQRKEAERGQEHTAPLPKARSFSWKKWAPIAASSLAVLVVGVFATWGFLSLKNGIRIRARRSATGVRLYMHYTKAAVKKQEIPRFIYKLAIKNSDFLDDTALPRCSKCEEIFGFLLPFLPEYAIMGATVVERKNLQATDQRPAVLTDTDTDTKTERRSI